MKEKDFTMMLVVVALCIDWSQAFYAMQKTDLVCPVVSDKFTNYPDPNNCSRYFECLYGEPVIYACAPGFLFDSAEGICKFADEVDCNGHHISTTPSTISPYFVCPVDYSGEYMNYPDPTSCSNYYECHLGQRVSRSCAPEFLFDPVEKICNFASEVVCNGTHISTTQSPVSPTSSPDFVCPVVSDEYVNYPDPKNCSRYYECHLGQRVSRSCAPEFLFDPVEKICNFASDVVCNGTKISTTPSPVSPTSSPNFACPVLSDEYMYYPDPTNCSRFYECHLGQRVLRSCAPDFFFDPVQKRCDFASDVDCIPTPMPTVDPPTRSPSTTPKYDFECPIVSHDVRTYADPYVCARYYICKDGRKLEMNCAPGFVFNEKTEDCDFPEHVDCNARSTSPNPTVPSTSVTTQTSIHSTPITVTVNPTTTTIQITTTTEENDNICKNKPDGTYIADPYDCKVFYECSNGVPDKLTCPSDTIWDQDILSCDTKRTNC